MAKSCSLHLEKQGSSNHEAFKPRCRKFPHWSSVLGEFKPRDSGVTAIMAYHAPLPIGYKYSLWRASAECTCVARHLAFHSASFSLPLPPLSLPSHPSCCQPLLLTPLASPLPVPMLPPPLGLPYMILLLPPTLCLTPTWSTSLTECASVAESCNHDLAHPYRDNDRSPDHGGWYLWPLRRDVEVVKLLILNERNPHEKPLARDNCRTRKDLRDFGFR